MLCGGHAMQCRISSRLMTSVGNAVWLKVKVGLVSTTKYCAETQWDSSVMGEASRRDITIQCCTYLFLTVPGLENEALEPG